MANSNPRNWMWAEALDMLARAERMHQQFFQPVRSAIPVPTWLPPVDVLESDNEVLVLVALPGVEPKSVEVAIEGGSLVVSGHRAQPVELMTAAIHRLEIPHGRFARAVPLPAGRYDDVRRAHANGLLVVALGKAREGGQS